MKFRPSPLDKDTCVSCEALRASHEWRCASCGMLATETVRCGCGVCELPKSACDCASSYGLFCREGMRKHDERNYQNLRRLLERTARTSSAAAIRLQWKWEWAEAERLQAAAS